MTDLVDRLRLGGPNALEVTDEAAAEIERLKDKMVLAVKQIDATQAEIERLQAALRVFVRRFDSGTLPPTLEEWDEARRALEKKP